MVYRIHTITAAVGISTTQLIIDEVDLQMQSETKNKLERYNVQII